MTWPRMRAWRRDSSGAPRIRSSTRSRWGPCASGRVRSTRSARGRPCYSGRITSPPRNSRAAAMRGSRSTWGSAWTSFSRGGSMVRRGYPSTGANAKPNPGGPEGTARPVRGRRRGGGLGRVGAEIERASLVALGLSVTVEGLQVFSPIRTASIVDVTTNTLGALGGALVVAYLLVALHRARNHRSYLGVPTFLPAGAYGLAALCEALTPLFRSTPLPRLYGGPLARLHATLGLALPLRLGEVPWSDLLLFAPVGFVVVMLLSERGHPAREAWPVVAAIGAACAFAAELVHGMFGLSIRWEAAATHAVAVGAGGWGGGRGAARAARHPRGVARGGGGAGPPRRGGAAGGGGAVPSRNRPGRGPRSRPRPPTRPRRGREGAPPPGDEHQRMGRQP